MFRFFVLLEYVYLVLGSTLAKDRLTMGSAQFQGIGSTITLTGSLTTTGRTYNQGNGFLQLHQNVTYVANDFFKPSSIFSRGTSITYDAASGTVTVTGPGLFKFSASFRIAGCTGCRVIGQWHRIYSGFWAVPNGNRAIRTIAMPNESDYGPAITFAEVSTGSATYRFKVMEANVASSGEMHAVVEQVA